MRLVGIDLARSVAVGVAMTSHALSATGLYWLVEDNALSVLIRVAPPVFICVFGMMLEIVYKPKFEGQDLAAPLRKLLARAIQCYILYVISILFFNTLNGYGLKYDLRSALLLGATPYTDILKFYAVILLLSPFLILARLRFGLAPLLGAIALLQIVYPWEHALPPITGFPGADILSSFLYGGTNVVGGPSILHGFTFVIFGMWMGSLARRAGGDGTLLGAKALEGRVMALVLAIALAGLMAFYPGPVLSDMASMVARNENHPVYYAFGCLGSLLFIDVFMRLARWTGMKPSNHSLFLGVTSLITFSYGNCVIYALMERGPGDFEPQQAPWTFAAMMVGFMSLSYAYFLFRNAKDRWPRTRWLAAYDYVTEGIFARATKVLVPESVSRWFARRGPTTRSL